MNLIFWNFLKWCFFETTEFHTVSNVFEWVGFPVADPGFSWGGRQLPKVGVVTYYFAENCMKMKEFGRQGGRASLAPPRSATGSTYLLAKNVQFFTALQPLYH